MFPGLCRFLAGYHCWKVDSSRITSMYLPRDRKRARPIHSTVPGRTSAQKHQENIMVPIFKQVSNMAGVKQKSVQNIGGERRPEQGAHLKPLQNYSALSNLTISVHLMERFFIFCRISLIRSTSLVSSMTGLIQIQK